MNYGALYQTNPGLFANNDSLANALYGPSPSGNADTEIFRQMKAFGNNPYAMASANPAQLFPQAAQFAANTGMTPQAPPPQAQMAGAPVMPRMAPPQAVVDPNNLPPPIFRR